jgi:Zn ribbon nucleic-acid-binding protein
MTRDGEIRWAPKTSRAKIRRLYETDAQGIVDEDLIDDVGWMLWQRCESILTVTAAHYGRVKCPSCQAIIERLNPWSDNELVVCAACGWQISWAAYHQTYRGKQLFGANAVDVFEAFHRDFPRARAANTKMLLIDQLIHAFHTGLTELGRPVAANLIEGSLGEVIRFLDALTNDGVSAAGLSDSRTTWRRELESLSWSHLFIEHEPPARSG